MIEIGAKGWCRYEGKIVAGEVVSLEKGDGYDLVVLFAESFELPARPKPTGPVVGVGFGTNRGVRPRFAYVMTAEFTRVD